MIFYIISYLKGANSNKIKVASITNKVDKVLIFPLDTFA